MGPNEEKILRYQKNNLPSRVLNAPELRVDLEIYYAGFVSLTTTRFIGWGEGQIPWTAINEYCKHNGIAGELREDFEYHIRRMDDAYLNFRERQRKAASPK